jgi:hypothetical protein
MFMRLIWSSKQLIGVNWHFAMFVCRPDTATNMSSTTLTTVMSTSDGTTKITRSLTYMARW